MKSSIEVQYNKCKSTKKLTDDCEGFSWVDNAGGSADTITMTLTNKSGKWFKNYMPDTRDTVKTWIKVEDWPGVTKNNKVFCGKFAVDSLGFSGYPQTLELSGLSVPISTGFNVRQKSHTWKKTTLHSVLRTIAKSTGIGLIYDAADHKISSISQSGQTDLEFAFSLCSDYGIALKLYNGKMCAYEKTKYEKKAAKHTISKGQEESYNISKSVAQTYNGVKIQYTSGKKKKTLSYEFHRPGTKGTRQMFVNEKAESLAQAQTKAKAALRENIRQAITVSITMRGNIRYMAAENVNLKGWGKLDGKYFIDTATHEKSGGKYTTTLDMHKCVTDF